MRALTLSLGVCWCTKWMVMTPPASSDLLLAAWKLERQNEARAPLIPKSTPTGGSNVTHSQTPVNLFLSQQLKGNQTFTAQLATVEGNEVGEDLDAKPK